MTTNKSAFKSIDTIMSAATPALPDREQILERVEQAIKDFDYFIGNNDQEIVKTLGVSAQRHFANVLKRFIEGEK